MPNPKTLVKQNPRLCQRVLQDGRASLFLEFYLGRHETPVLDATGNPVVYTDGPSAGRVKYKVTHERKKENLNLYIWLNPRINIIIFAQFHNRQAQENQHRMANPVNTSVNRKKLPDFVHELLFGNFITFLRSADLFTVRRYQKHG